MKKLAVVFALGVLASGCGGGGDALSTADLETECVKIAEKSDAAQEAMESDPTNIKGAMSDVLSTQQEFFDAMSRWEETTNPDGFTDLKSVMGDMSKIISDVDTDDPAQLLEEAGPKLDELMENWEGKLTDAGPQDWVTSAGRNGLPAACENLMEVVL